MPGPGGSLLKRAKRYFVASRLAEELYTASNTLTHYKMSQKYQIGDFSRISGISVKTLRYYQEYGILNPSFVDETTGYRYYDERILEKAGIIHCLKDLDFSLNEIKEILSNCEDDSEIVPYLTRKTKEISEKISKYHQMKKRMDDILKLESQMNKIKQDTTIKIIDIPDLLVATIRFQGKYEEVGKAFGKLFKNCGRAYAGSNFSLYYQAEFQEIADIEAGISLKKEIKKEGIACKVLPGGKALSTIHQGPYTTVGESYKRILDFKNQNNLKTMLPTRELYLKGPGMILRGNPLKYVTELQMFLDES